MGRHVRRAVEVTFCVVNTEQRELLLRGLDAIARERAALPFATEVLVLDNASTRRLGRGGRAAHPAVDEVIALERAPRQGRERLRAAAARARALRAAAQRGLRAAARRDARRCARRSRRDPRAGARGRAAAAPRRARPAVARGASRRRATALAGGALPAPPADRAEPRRRGRARSTGRSRAALLVRARGGRAGRLVRPRRSSSTPTRSTSAGGCADAGWRTLYVPGARGDPPRAALDRRGARAAHRRARRATATATCASTTPRLPRALVRWLTAWTYARARARRARAARPRPAALLAPRHGDAASRRAARACARRRQRATTAAAGGSERGLARWPALAAVARTLARRETTPRRRRAPGGDREPDARAASDEARGARGRQQQLAGDRDPAGDERRRARAAPTRTAPRTAAA